MNIKILTVCVFSAVLLMSVFSILILRLPSFVVAEANMSDTFDAANDDLDQILRDAQMSNSTINAANDDLDQILRDAQKSNSTGNTTS